MTGSAARPSAGRRQLLAPDRPPTIRLPILDHPRAERLEIPDPGMCGVEIVDVPGVRGCGGHTAYVGAVALVDDRLRCESESAT
ncbi:MAG: hypothetical protein M3071_22465 [Actinomycetota bacterium]|nr:hypothetical protein [Actinomycetota bacterium]